MSFNKLITLILTVAAITFAAFGKEGAAFGFGIWAVAAWLMVYLEG